MHVRVPRPLSGRRRAESVMKVTRWTILDSRARKLMVGMVRFLSPAEKPDLYLLGIVPGWVTGLPAHGKTGAARRSSRTESRSPGA